MQLSKMQWRVVHVINAISVGASIALAVHVHWIFLVPLVLNAGGVYDLLKGSG